MKTILIVDDSVFIRNMLKDIIKIEQQSIFYPTQTFEADGKKTALQLLSQIVPDVVMVDIIMQESALEGLELVEELKKRFSIKNIIVISSVKQPFITTKCRELGINSYLQKPFVPIQVVTAINSCFKH